MSYLNEDQESYAKYLATVPRDERCGSGWHIVGKETCNCGPYQPCVVYGCLRQRSTLPGSRNQCYEHMRAAANSAPKDSEGEGVEDDG